MSYDTYGRFTRAVDRKLQRLGTEVDEGLAKVYRAFEGNAKFLLPVVVVPGTQPTALVAYALAKDDLDGEVARVRAAYRRAVDETWKIVKRLTGEPVELEEGMSKAYLAAAKRISDEDYVMRRLDAEVREHWQGLAHAAYEDVSAKQRVATVAVADGLRAAANACTDGAYALRDAWGQVTWDINDAINDVQPAIEEGTDHSGWVSLDPGPAVAVLEQVPAGAETSQVTLDEKLDAMRAHDWAPLNSGLDGLRPGNDWPRLSTRDREAIDDEDSWKRR